MKPASPVVKGSPEIVIAKNQPQYLPLPAIVCQDGTVISRWKLAWWERILIFIRGDLYLRVLTFHRPLQPQRPSVCKPRLQIEWGIK